VTMTLVWNRPIAPATRGVHPRRQARQGIEPSLTPRPHRQHRRLEAQGSVIGQGLDEGFYNLAAAETLAFDGCFCDGGAPWYPTTARKPFHDFYRAQESLLRSAESVADSPLSEYEVEYRAASSATGPRSSHSAIAISNAAIAAPIAP